MSNVKSSKNEGCLPDVTMVGVAVEVVARGRLADGTVVGTGAAATAAAVLAAPPLAFS